MAVGIQLPQLTRVDELKKEIDQLRPLSPDRELRIMEKFRLDWNYHSNAIEGNRLTMGETKVFLLEGLTAHGKPLKDHLDIKGHNELLGFLEGFVQRKEVLTEAAIREMHKILLREPYQVEAKTPEGGTTTKWVKLGEYKTEPNCVLSETGEVRRFLPPEDTAPKMQELLDWFRKESSARTTHPLIIAAIFHHRFTQIHPFDDGNGRMARILMNLFLMQTGYPPVIIKKERRELYLAALLKADAGEQGDLITLIAEEEIASEELFLRGARGESIADFDDVDKRISLLKQELKHIEEPAELTSDIQKQFFSQSITPVITRLVKKVSQFDELYSGNKVILSGSAYLNNWSSQSWGPSSEPTRANLLRFAETQIQGGVLFRELKFGFFWEGFKRDHLNTFSEGFWVTFEFHRYKYVLHTDKGPLRLENVYQVPLTEDQILGLINGIAESCFRYIESQIRMRKT